MLCVGMPSATLASAPGAIHQSLDTATNAEKLVPVLRGNVFPRRVRGQIRDAISNPFPSEQPINAR